MVSPRIRTVLAALLLAASAVGCRAGDHQETRSVASTGEYPAELAANRGGQKAPSDGTDETSSTTSPESTTTSAPPTTGAPAPTAPSATAPPATAPPATAPPPPPPTTAPPPPAVSAGVSNNCESMMTSSINASRASAGVAALADDGGIRHIARNWSSHMASTGVLQHNSNMPSQVDAVRPWLSVGENVGTYTELSALYQAFMDSPTHRANILASKYSYVSVGCVQTSSGTYWVTQLFWG